MKVCSALPAVPLGGNPMRLLSLVVILVLCSSVVLAYPKIDYRSVSEKDQLIYNQIEKSIDEKYFVGVTKIIVYGREMWYPDGWFTDRGVIMIDKGGLYNFKFSLTHELKHSKCWKEARDLSHDSQCFTNGLA